MFVRGDECRPYGQVILNATDDYTFLLRFFLSLKVIQASSFDCFGGYHLTNSTRTFSS